MRSHRELSTILVIGMMPSVLAGAEAISEIQPGATAEERAATARPDAAWQTPEVVAVRTRRASFASSLVGQSVTYHVYLPAAYDESAERRFPVLYWLHGSGGGLAGIPFLAASFHDAISRGRMQPMIVVFPNGHASSMWCDSADGSMPMESLIIQELLPHIDRTLRTIADRSGRWIEGFSMGGYGAARLGLAYDHLFGAVSVFAGGPLDLDFAGPRATERPEERAQIMHRVFGDDLGRFRQLSPLTIAASSADRLRGRSRIRVVVGSADNTGELNRRFARHLDALGLAATLVALPEVGHSMPGILSSMGDKMWDFYAPPVR